MNTTLVLVEARPTQTYQQHPFQGPHPAESHIGLPMGKDAATQINDSLVQAEPLHSVDCDGPSQHNGKLILFRLVAPVFSKEGGCHWLDRDW